MKLSKMIQTTGSCECCGKETNFPVTWNMWYMFDMRKWGPRGDLIACIECRILLTQTSNCIGTLLVIK